jgi:L-ascorbate metabolism protein UlaG (beta-lactamase superfamily)
MSTETIVKRFWQFVALAVAYLASWSGTGAAPFPDPRIEQGLIAAPAAGFMAEARDPACFAPTLVSTGGAFPRSPRTLAIRWTGFANFELAYNGQILLLDAYFDRGSYFPPLGFKAEDVKRANVILIGHGHTDHMSDAASVGVRTGAPVVGAPVTAEKLLTQPIDPKQVRTVTGRGGEVLRFGSFTVEPILGRHGEPPPFVTAAFQQALKASAGDLTPGQITERDEIRLRGIRGDARVINEGTIAFLITLDNGFRILFRDSGGRITDYERAAMERVGRVDVALVAVSAAFIQALVVEQALEHLRTYRPDVFIPAHHDAALNGLWRPTEPLFLAMKSEKPDLVTVSKGYREPVCFNTEDNVQRRGKK